MHPEPFGSPTPRIWTPPLRPLTKRTSLGFQAIEFGHDVMEVTLDPWQEFVLIHGLELDPTEKDLFRFDTILVLAARQNGKTECMKVLALWSIYLDGAKTVIGTAQDLATSEKAWLETVDTAMGIPDLAAEIKHVDKVNGQKSLRLHGGQQYAVKAASRRGARGFTGDRLLLDELREHQTWDSWAASTKTTLARPRSQVWAFSNAGDAASIVLRHLRLSAMRSAIGLAPGELDEMPLLAVEEDDEDAAIGDSLGIMEWSAIPGCDVHDRAGWRMANPSLGHGRMTERKIAAAIRTDPEWVVREEVLCQWRSTAAGGPFPDGAWIACMDNLSEIAPNSPLAICVDQSFDSVMVWVALAAYRTDGNIHLEMIERRAGTDWLIPWLQSPDRPTFGAITFQANGAPISALKDEFTASGLPVVEWAGSDLARAAGAFWELVREPLKADPDNKDLEKRRQHDEVKQRVFHLVAPGLDVAASQAVTKQLGDAWVIDRRRSPVDAAPLIAATGAAWVLGQIKVPVRSKYEDEDLVTV